MAASRRRQPYAERIASYKRRHPGASTQEARGKGARHRPEGHTEASYRRQREETAVLRGERGLTSADRQTIRNWYISRAKKMTDRGAEWGAPAVARTEAIANWENDKSAWEKAGMRAFERVRDALEETDTGKLWFDHGGEVTGDNQRAQAVVMVNFIDAINAEYGLSLDNSLHFALLYKPKRPQAEAA